jgi:hypothetical protein
MYLSFLNHSDISLMSFQVSVTLNIGRENSGNIGGVISAIADLLKIAVPPSYEISRSPSPPPVNPATDVFKVHEMTPGKRKSQLSFVDKDLNILM